MKNSYEISNNQTKNALNNNDTTVNSLYNAKKNSGNSLADIFYELKVKYYFIILLLIKKILLKIFLINQKNNPNEAFKKALSGEDPNLIKLIEKISKIIFYLNKKIKQFFISYALN